MFYGAAVHFALKYYLPSLQLLFVVVFISSRHVNCRFGRLSARTAERKIIKLVSCEVGIPQQLSYRDDLMRLCLGYERANGYLRLKKLKPAVAINEKIDYFIFSRSPSLVYSVVQQTNGYTNCAPSYTNLRPATHTQWFEITRKIIRLFN